jgi:predicted Zn-dependent protease
VLGRAYAAAGQSERAILTLSHAAEHNPSDTAAYVALGRVWLEMAQTRHDRVALNKALEALAHAAGIDGSSEALTLFGRALLLAGEPEKAERTLQDAIRAQPVDALAFYYLADAAERQGHFAPARDALLDYAALRGDQADARKRGSEATRLGDLSLRAGDPASAAVYFLEAADAAPGDAGLLARAADAQLRAGDADTARGTVARALEKDPHNPLALAVLQRAGR